MTVYDNAMTTDAVSTGGGVPVGDDSAGDAVAVSELIADIEAELRLHQARVQEFLDGTREFGAISTTAERARLLRTSQALSSVLSDLSDLL